MREILFRGQRVGSEEWVEGFYLTSPEFDNQELAVITTDKPRNPYYVSKETIGQYTGLTDKNGTKIFEGDILRYGLLYDYECYLESIEHPEEYDNEIYDQDIEVSEVKWCSDCDYPAFDLADHDFECNGISQIMCGDYEYEVIGNIHDNPELLKEDDNDE